MYMFLLFILLCMYTYIQQEQVLRELYWYVNQNPLPDDASEVRETLSYLEARSLLFE